MGAFVAAREVVRTGEHALLLLSGGADSMALLHLLPIVDRQLRLGLRLSALHVDYRARGADSDRDRVIVEGACAALGVPLRVVRLRRKLEGPDFQERARALRYAHARTLAAEQGCDVLVTAHNRDDQAETVLYRLTKYASPRGLAGMRPRDGQLARPLLCLGAAEVRAYCAAHGIRYGEDLSNLDPRYARNLIRLEVLPVLARVNPRVVETLAASAELAAAEAEVLADEARAVLTRAWRDPGDDELAALSAEELLSVKPALRALAVHDWLRDYLGGDVLVERRPVESVVALLERCDEGARASLRGGLEAVRGGGLLRLRRRGVRHHCEALALDGDDLIQAGSRGVGAVFCDRRLAVRLAPGAVGPTTAACATVGLSAPPREVVIRHPRSGERFAPLGLSAETTVARHLAGVRVPADRRPCAVVLDIGGRAAWVGYTDPGGRLRGRVAEAHRVDESTAWTLIVCEEEA